MFNTRAFPGALGTLGIMTVLALFTPASTRAEAETNPGHAQADRMAWWREARFGLFIHWGLYSIPAGEWGEETDHHEWIMSSAQIPVEEYERFADRFDPQSFDAEAWVRMAKDAGMKYIVLTTKHHEGFCLFDSAFTDYDVAATPFKRDIVQELAEACRRQDMRLGLYYSIIDWHHPDYLPRRPWETRPAEGADYERYARYLKSQVGELLTRYGDVGLLWFDGQWEGTWTHEHGKDLYLHARTLQPGVLVNDRVDLGHGMEGSHAAAGMYVGDYHTPEQTIPTEGLPGLDWETCMTMNKNWGYNKHDNNWKSSRELIQKLVDIASKGGNFLLNVGPTADGAFPEPSVERLAAIGRWMKVNSVSIHGTSASAIGQPAWGRCTTRKGPGDSWLLYLHVFDWPADGRLTAPALDNEILGARLLAGGDPLSFESGPGELRIALPPSAPDANVSVVAVRVSGKPVLIAPPLVRASSETFVDGVEVALETEIGNATLRYTTDGSAPTASSPLYHGPLRIEETTALRAALFREDQPLGTEARARFTRVEPRPGVDAESEELQPGLSYAYYEGSWTNLPDFRAIEPKSAGTTPATGLGLRARDEHFGLRFTGFLRIPADDVYTFYSDSDDGSRVFIHGQLVIDNDGLHGRQERSGSVALKAGLHPVVIEYFEGTGGQELDIGVSTTRTPYQALPAEWFFYRTYEP